MMISRQQRCRVVALVLAMLWVAEQSPGQQLTIGIIDFYGLGRVSEREVREALTVKEGDKVSFDGDERPAFLAASERRLSTVPGVVRAHLNLTCCEDGRATVYVGIEETGRAATTFRPAPTGSARLGADIVKDGENFDTAMMAAVQRGDAEEDDSRGTRSFTIRRRAPSSSASSATPRGTFHSCAWFCASPPIPASGRWRRRSWRM